MKSAALLYSQETHPFFRGFFGLHLLPVPIIVETVDPFSISAKWLTNCPFAYFSDPLTTIPETEAQTKRTPCHHIPIYFFVVTFPTNLLRTLIFTASML